MNIAISEHFAWLLKREQDQISASSASPAPSLPLGRPAGQPTGIQYDTLAQLIEHPSEYADLFEASIGPSMEPSVTESLIHGDLAALTHLPTDEASRERPNERIEGTRCRTQEGTIVYSAPKTPSRESSQGSSPATVPSLDSDSACNSAALSAATPDDASEAASPSRPIRLSWHSIDGAGAVYPKPKRSEPVQRSTVSAYQAAVLLHVFERNPFPETSERAQLAEQLSLSARQVQVWFQNRRQRQRKPSQARGKRTGESSG